MVLVFVSIELSFAPLIVLVDGAFYPRRDLSVEMLDFKRRTQVETTIRLGRGGGVGQVLMPGIAHLYRGQQEPDDRSFSPPPGHHPQATERPCRY